MVVAMLVPDLFV